MVALPFEGIDPPDGRVTFDVDVAGISGAVERTMALLFQSVRCAGEDDRDSFRLALTEALNNVVEHSRHPESEPVFIHVGHSGRSAWACVEDAGVVLPPHLLGLSTIAPKEPPTDTLELLPEGGWGWTLIRASVHRLDHTRRAGRNFTLLMRHFDGAAKAADRSSGAA
ncbi:MAG: ATP-binding protein [Pseudomonadota bacterium]